MNRADVEMLNRAIGGMGQSFLQNRQLEQAANDRELDRQMRQQLMDEQVAARRDASAASKEHFGAEQQHYKNIEGQQAAAAKAEQEQAELKDDQTQLQNLMHLNAGGMITEEGLKRVNAWLSNHPRLSKTGIQLQRPPAEPPKQVGQNSVAAAFQQADSWGQKAEAARAAGDSSKAAEYDKYKSQLVDSVDPTAYDTITTRVPDPNNQGKFLEERTHKVKRDAPAAGISASGFQQWQQNNSAPGPAPAPPSALTGPAPDWHSITGQ